MVQSYNINIILSNIIQQTLTQPITFRLTRKNSGGNNYVKRQVHINSKP